MRRVLLLELACQEQRRHHRAEFFPFLQGLARRLGLGCRWRSLLVPPRCMHVGSRYVVDLPAAQRARLGRELGAWSPDVIVLHDRPAPGLLRMLRRAAPRARVADLSALPRAAARPAPRMPREMDYYTTVAEASSLLGEAGRAPRGIGGGRFLVDAVLPLFARRSLDSPGGTPPAGPVRLAVDMYCPYQRPVRGNRFYRGLDSEAVRGHRGCAFCHGYGRMELAAQRRRFRSSPAAIALRQIEAHQRAAGGRPGPCEYIFLDASFNVRIDRFLAQVLRRGLRPATFTTMMRLDTLLALQPGLERVLPRLAAAGHRLSLISLGAENFSADENERFNKGLSAEQIWRAYGLIRDLEARFPRAFGSGDSSYLAAILFTPWTRPEDLRENLAAARRLPVEWLQRAVGQRLQLWEGTPLAELARRDGLTVEEPGALADAAAVCQSNPDARELHWRFADERTAAIHRLLVRLDPMPWQAAVKADDPLLLALRRERGRLPRQEAQDYVGLAGRIVDGVCRLGPKAGVAQLLGTGGSRSGRAQGIRKK